MESKGTCDGRTPLLWAARNRHEVVVTLPLKQDAELGSKSRYGQTSLSCVARNGHEAVMNLVLEQGAKKPQ